MIIRFIESLGKLPLLHKNFDVVVYLAELAVVLYAGEESGATEGVVAMGTTTLR